MNSFKSLRGENYDPNISDNSKSGVAVQKDIVILRDGLILEPEPADVDDDDVAVIVEQPHVVEPIAESIPTPIKIISKIVPEIIETVLQIFHEHRIEEHSNEPLPVEAPEQEARRKLIQKNLDKSQRMREIGIANRARHQTPPASPSHPAHALPVYKCGSFITQDSLRDVPDNHYNAVSTVKARPDLNITTSTTTARN